MDLSFLDKQDVKMHTVKQPIKILTPEEESNVKVIDFTYDKSKAELKEEGQTYPIPLDLPYIKRGIEYVHQFGYKVCFSLKKALTSRANGEKVVTIREADIAYRRKMDFNNAFLMSVLLKFDGFLTEDTPYLTEGIFHTRIRYNKGLLWKKLHFASASLEKQHEGLQKIEILGAMLSIFGLPLHEEEKTSGLHAEFHKPDYLSWDQFNARYKEYTQSQTLAVKLRMLEVENLAKEQLGIGVLS